MHFPGQRICCGGVQSFFDTATNPDCFQDLLLKNRFLLVLDDVEDVDVFGTGFGAGARGAVGAITCRVSNTRRSK